MRNAYVWVRMGDQGGYESFDSPYAAGFSIGQFTSEEDVRFRDKGLEIGPFFNLNYISLFWGDGEAQPVNESNLTQAERDDFLAGLNDGQNN